MKKFAALTAASVAVLFVSATAAPISDADEDIRTGEFQLTRTVAEVAGADSAAAMKDVIPADEPYTWLFFVPQSYRPDNPARLMVYVSPSDSGKIPPSWKTVLDGHNLI